MAKLSRRSVGLAAIALLGAVTDSAAGQAAVKASPAASSRAREVAREIMKTARFCALSTIGDESQPQARVIDPLVPTPEFTVYFATNPRSRKVTELRKNPRVALLYFDAAGGRYVTLIGQASEVSGTEKGAHHKPDWEAFFPIAKPDAYLLYRVDASRLEVVSAGDGFSGDPSTWRPEIVDLKPPRK